MSNPFDQFATEVRAAVPDVPAPAPPADMGAFQAPAPASVMNPPPQANGYGGYGAQPPMAQPPMSQPPMAQPPASPYGAPAGGYGMPPQGGAFPMANGGDFGSPSPMAPAPAAPMSSFSSPPLASDPFGGGGGGGGYGQPPAPAPPVPGASPPFGMPEAAPEAAPQAAPPSPEGNPFGAPAPPQPGAMPPSPGVPAPAAPAASDNPFGAPASPMPPTGAPPMPPQGAPPMPPQGAPPMPPAGAPPMPYGADPAQAAVPPAQPTQSQYSADPWGAPAPGAMVPAGQPPADPMAGALVPSQPASQQYGNIDPFSVFENAPAPPPAPEANPYAVVPAPAPVAPQPVAAAPPAQNEDDLWADMGFDAPVPDAPKAEESAPAPAEGVEKSNLPPGELPPGGEWYDARIFTPTLGVMFFKPQELTDSLFLQTDKEIVDALEERPVVAFIVEGSSARSAGVELGHVLLKVNGIDVKNPKEASRLIKEGPRPLPLLFYVPDTTVVVAEGEHMVKYDTRETTAPNSAKDWKPKYVVIGGIIAQPWMMNMYRSKVSHSFPNVKLLSSAVNQVSLTIAFFLSQSEYDIAVIETQARRPVSVKVKQFSLQGARIQNDWQGPQMVKYKNKLHPWKYIVVLPVARNPIKISSPNLSQLKPVHEGIRRVLLSQQRDRGHHSHTAGPVRGGDPYARPQNGHGGGHGGGDPYGHGGPSHGGGGGGYDQRGPPAGGYDSRPPQGHGGGGDPYARGGDPYARGGDPYARGGDPYARGGGGGGTPYNNY